MYITSWEFARFSTPGNDNNNMDVPIVATARACQESTSNGVLGRGIALQRSSCAWISEALVNFDGWCTVNVCSSVQVWQHPLQLRSYYVVGKQTNGVTKQIT